MANIVVTTSNLDVTVGETTSNIVVTDASSNVFVTNVATAVANITVSSAETNVNVSQSAVISNAAVRSRISTRSIYKDIGGTETLDGPSGYLEYDEANGVVKLYQTRFHSSMFNENLSGDKNYEVSLDTGYLNSTSNTWLSTKTTSDLTEGTNLYYTQARFDSALANKSTTDLSEGTNLYYTNARVQAYVVDSGLDYNAEKVLNGITAGNVTLKQYQETYYDAGTLVGNTITLDVANGTMQRITIDNNVTGITLTNIQAGGHMTILVTQDNTGNKSLQGLDWTNWQWAGDYTTLNPGAGEDTVITIQYDGTTYSASVVRFDAYNTFSGKTTDDLPEGSTNLYYTSSRALVDANIAIANNTTDNLSEGSTNEYFTTARARQSISATGDINYDNTTGVISFTETPAIVTSVNTQTGAVVLDTDDIAEGVGNLYFTNTRASQALSINQQGSAGDGSLTYNAGTGVFDYYAADVPNSTNDLTEGSSNLYFTTDRANVSLVQYLGDAVNAPFTINGNLDVQGNLNYVNVEDLLVRDQTIFINVGQVAQDSSIVVDRQGVGGGANVDLKWDETADRWQFTNDGSTYNNMLTSADLPADAVSSVNTFTGAVVLDTDNINEGTTNLYYTDARADARVNLQTGTNLDLSSKSTTDLSEGTNLYYTQSRFDTAFTAKDTDDLSEGTTNEYYTQARFDSAFGATDTDALAEGTTNLYFTTPRQRAGFSVTTGTPSGDGALSYNSTTGVFAFTPADHPTDAVTSVNTQTGVVVLDTDDIAEGTAKYYATSLFNTDFATKTTTDLTEGTNLYYTDGRFDTRLATKSTTDLAEGTNLYYTESRVRGDISTTTASASSGGSLAYNSTSGVFTFAPADLSAKIELTDLSVTQASASGTGALAYDNTTGVFTYTPPVLPTGDITDVVAGVGLSGGGTSGAVTLTLDPTITTGTASGGGALAYNNATGVFTFTPAIGRSDSEVRALLSTTTASASGGGSLAYDNGTGVFTFAPAEVVSNAQVTAYIETNGLNATSLLKSSANIHSTENIIGTALRTRNTVLSSSYLWSGQLLNTYSGDTFGDSADAIYIEVDRAFQVTPVFGPQQISFTGYTGNGATNLNGVDFWINGADMSGFKTVYKIFTESTGTTQASISTTGITVTNGAGPTNGVVNGRYWSAGDHDLLYSYTPGIFTMSDDLGEFLRMDSANTSSQQGQFEFIRPMKMKQGVEITNDRLVLNAQEGYSYSAAATDVDETDTGFYVLNGRASVETFNNASPSLNKETGVFVSQASDQANSVFSVPRVSTLKLGAGHQAVVPEIAATNFNDVSAAMPDGSWSRADDSKIIRRRDYDYLLNGVYYPVATGAAQHTVASTVYKTSDTSQYVRAALPTATGSPYYTNAMISQGVVAFRTMQPAVAANIQNGFPYNVGTDDANSTVMFIDDKFNIGNEEDATKAYSFPKTPGANNTVLVMDTNKDLQFVDFQAKMDEHFENLLRKYIGTINLINPESGGAALYTQAYVDMFGGYANTTVFSNNIDGGNA